MKDLLTLKEWFKSNFDGLYCPRKVARWASQGQLHPAAIKSGKTYYVQPATVWVKPKKLNNVQAKISRELEALFNN